MHKAPTESQQWKSCQRSGHRQRTSSLSFTLKPRLRCYRHEGDRTEKYTVCAVRRRRKAAAAKRKQPMRRRLQAPAIADNSPKLAISKARAAGPLLELRCQRRSRRRDSRFTRLNLSTIRHGKTDRAASCKKSQPPRFAED